MLKNVDAKLNSVRGLVAQIAQAQQHANIASSAKDKEKAAAKVKSLESKKAEIEKQINDLNDELKLATEMTQKTMLHKKLQLATIKLLVAKGKDGAAH